MRRLKRVGVTVGRWMLRPSVWGPVLVLLMVVAGSLALARLVITPTILASNQFTTPLPVNRTKMLKQRQSSAPVSSRRANGSAEPAIQISFVQKEAPKRKRQRNRRPRNSMQTKDVVFHAPRDVRSFADSAPREPLPEPDPSIDPPNAEDERRDDDMFRI